LHVLSFVRGCVGCKWALPPTILRKHIIQGVSVYACSFPVCVNPPKEPKGMKVSHGHESDSDRVPSDDDEPKMKLAGFADAMKKLLHRSVNAEGAPVLAKRHTAAEKRAVIERQTAAQAKVVAAERTKVRKAHHSEPSVEPNIVLEKALRRVATIGGTCVVRDFTS
jgi:hypothetical protein